MRRMIRTVAIIGLLVHSAAAENWPRFRGPTGQGISHEVNLPIHWTEETNVAWKIRVAGLGWSSPIVWNDFVFVTTATNEGADCHVMAIDRRTGETIWDTIVLQQAPERKEGKNSYATPTPVTDGERVYAVFGDGSIVAIGFDGKLLWTNREIRHYSRHGLGASPILFKDRLIMTYDGSNRVAVPGDWPNNSDEERLGWQIPWDQAQIVALDTSTGKRIWIARRGKSRVAHATPNLLEQEGQFQLVSTAGDAIQGFDLDSGERLWTVYSKGEGVVPSPVIGDGLVFTSSGFEETTIRTVKADGRGDVTATHIAWEQRSGAPTQPSMLFVDPHLYAVSDNGVVSCYEARSGEIVWKQRVGGNHCASPVYADGKIYTLSEGGETAVFETGPQFKLVARNALNERCQASIAISQGNLFIRTAEHLYCIGQNPR